MPNQVTRKEFIGRKVRLIGRNTPACVVKVAAWEGGIVQLEITKASSVAWPEDHFIDEFRAGRVELLPENESED